MDTVTQQVRKRPLNRQMVRDGVNGNTQAVFEMIRMVRNSVDYDLGFEAFAQTIIDKNIDVTNIRSNEQAKLQLIFDFVKSNVKYVQDLKGQLESLKSARVMLRDGWGDADDLTILNCTLLGCLGFEDVKIALAKVNETDTTFSHVYCVVYIDSVRYVFDTSLQNAEINKENHFDSIKEISVFEHVNGLDGFGGIYQTARCQFRKLTRFTIRAIPSAVNVLPLGFLAANALATGATLIDQSTAHSTLSLSNTASKINTELDQIILDLLSSRIAYDLAKTQALQLAAQLAAVDTTDENYTLRVVGASIKGKLDFINKFPAYAQQHDIKLVYLDATKMLCAGLILAGGTGYLLYRGYKNTKKIF